MHSDIYYMKKAMQMAENASENGEIPVGSLLLLADGREFAEHNAPITLHDTSAHAEMQVIRSACKTLKNYRLPAGSTLYVTLEPCSMCAGAIIHARIDRVVYGASDSKTGAVDSLYQLLSDQRLNHQPKITSGIMAEESSALLKQFFKDRRQCKKKKRVSSIS